MNKGALNAILLSVFGTALVTTLVFPNRPTSAAIQMFFFSLANAIRAMLGTKDVSSKTPLSKGLQGLSDYIVTKKKD